jgi:hypothetical protein
VSACPTCKVLADEVLAARAAVREDIDASGYLDHHAAVEFARVWEDPTGDRLYVHCEPAWMESDAEFRARSRRVRDTLVRRHRLKPHAEDSETVAPAPHDVTHLFTGRLDDGT